ncbi:WD40 repeat domain-containing protein, partial [Candidatus Marithioploca araucensis]|nr:WD40 repeat domain-containing protein [Candidatus Marithioploca araucensis]
SLYAGGTCPDGKNLLVLRWSQAGQRSYTEWQASSNTITDIRSLKNGRIVYSAGDPSFAVLDNVGNKIVEQEASIADYRNTREVLLISDDGNTINFDFEFGFGGERPARFSLSEQSLIHYPQPDTNLISPDTSSLDITDWKSTSEPKLNGKDLPLIQYERSRSLAIAPDKSKFLLGTSWNLYLFDTNGQPIWKFSVPSAVLGVNISSDGKKAVAAYGDGTIRWYNMKNGKALLAFFPHKDGRRWVAWTKSGYYMASADNADNMIGWHVNNGKDKEASFYPAGALYASYKRPDIVKKILETLDEDEAIRLANIEKGVESKVNVDEAIEEVKDKYQLNLEPSGLGKAIIVAASGAQDSKLFPYTNEFTMKMYRLLHKSGFSDGDIIYMNPYPPIVPVNGYVDAARQDFPMLDPKTELQQAIAQVNQDLQPGEQFVFYLHGHARADSVHIGRQSYLSAQEIKTLLAQIPTDVEQIIIFDTCYSGSFLDELANVPKRVVISSADAKSLAWSTESLSFADSFIRQLRYGRSVGEAFELAEQTLTSEPKIFGAQRPQLDDTQDGVYAEEDGHFANRIYLGGEKAPETRTPEIIDVHPTIRLLKGKNTATLWITAIPDFNGMKTVRAILVNEHDEATVYQGDNTEFTRRELTLKPNYDLQRYEIESDQFHTANNWKIL